MRRRGGPAIQAAAIVAVAVVWMAAAAAADSDPVSKQWPEPGYDFRRPPKNADGSPVKINVSVKFESIPTTDEGEGTAVVGLKVSALWEDTRLMYSHKFDLRENERFVPVSPTEIWTPEFGFRPTVLTRTHMQQARVFPAGHVHLVQLVDITVAADYNLRWFPFDKQNITFETYVWAYSTDEISLVTEQNWMPWTSTLVTMPFALSKAFVPGKTHWNVEDFQGKIHTTQANSQGQAFEYIALGLIVSRSPLYYFFAYFVPVMIISLTASTSFYIHFEEAGSRISVALSAILALIGMDFVLLSDMPRAGYVYWVHVYLLGQFVLVVMPLFVHFYVAHWYRRGGDYDLLSTEELAKKRTSVCHAVVWYVKWLLPSGYTSKAVMKIDSCGFLFYLFLFAAFNAVMFLVAYVFYDRSMGNSEVHLDRM